MKDKRNQYASLAFIGCMFIGMGVGYIIGNLVGPMFIGMGVGYIARMAVLANVNEDAPEHE